MGVRAGFPDLGLYIARGKYHGLFIELKTAKGRQTDNQKYFQKALKAQGYRYEVARSLDEFRMIVTQYMNEKQDDYDRRDFRGDNDRIGHSLHYRRSPAHSRIDCISSQNDYEG
jgi:hypothetical protein